MIYLAGPYTSKTLNEHLINIGRLYTYHIYLNMIQDQEFVFCPPIETAGYETGVHEVSEQGWIEKSSEGLKCCDKVYFTPKWGWSVGCCEELKLASHLELQVSFLGIIPREFLVRIEKHADMMVDRNPSLSQSVWRYLNLQYHRDFTEE